MSGRAVTQTPTAHRGSARIFRGYPRTFSAWIRDQAVRAVIQHGRRRRACRDLASFITGRLIRRDTRSRHSLRSCGMTSVRSASPLRLSGQLRMSSSRIGADCPRISADLFRVDPRSKGLRLLVSEPAPISGGWRYRGADPFDPFHPYDAFSLRLSGPGWAGPSVEGMTHATDGTDETDTASVRLRRTEPYPATPKVCSCGCEAALRCAEANVVAEPIRSIRFIRIMRPPFD